MATPRADTLLQTGTVTFLFTDIEGSTRLWEQDRERMSAALARHDALARAAVEDRGGTVVKMTGDGMCAVFGDPVDALNAALALLQSLADQATTSDLSLHVRCGLHAGIVEHRDNDFFGPPVNRAARIMSAAHGGQILLSQVVAGALAGRLPEGVTLRDLGAVRLRDLARPERVYQVVHQVLRQEFPALRSLESTPNNLPQQVTSFVGRERGLAEAKQLLASTPLLTLLGMGGLGKTRLSLQVAADVMDDYPDGVWFVELASVADARLVPQAVASVLGVMEEVGRPVMEALVKYVKDRQLLVILDNCEHLVRACAELATQLLRSGARLRLLASSRECLHVPGETTYPVQALALPDPHRTIAVAALLQYEAVRLFVDRAQAVQPAFQVTPANAQALAGICQRLDGIPLAIELAAARVRSLSVETIAERLTDRFRLLTHGNRTDLPHQQTLRALIDWSYDLLDPAEKTLFARLSVFAGGFTLNAAEALGAGGTIDTAGVLDLLTALVEKSLVEFDAAGERYRMLETVRQYTQEKLDASEEAVTLRTAHLAYFLALAEIAQPELWGPEQGRWLARLDLERENFLSAHAWCDRAENGAEQGLRLVFAMQLYWLPRGLIELGYRITVEALARAGQEQRDLNVSGASYAACQIAYYMGAYAQSKLHGEKCLAIACEFGIRERQAAAHLILGYVCEGLGERAASMSHFEASAALARDLGDKGRLSFALNAMAGLHQELRDLAAAERLFEESLRLARELDDMESIAIGLSNLVRVRVDRGVSERAHELLLEGLTIARKIDSTRGCQDAVEAASLLAVLLAAWVPAASLYGAIEARMEKMGIHRAPADERFLRTQITSAREALGDVAFAAAETAGRARPWEQTLDDLHEWLEQKGVQLPTPRSPAMTCRAAKSMDHE